MPISKILEALLRAAGTVRPGRVILDLRNLVRVCYFEAIEKWKDTVSLAEVVMNCKILVYRSM
jgi:hypothetical protein